MTNPQEEIQDLAIRAKEYYKEVEKIILSFRKDDRDLIIGLDPKGKKYWIGETESSILEQKQREQNNNLVYFIKLTAKKTPEKLFIITQ